MDYEFSPGDKVVIREWEDMKEEYGGSDRRIEIHPDGIAFVREMRNLCGKEATVSHLTVSRGGYPRIIFKERMDGWTFSPHMVRPVESHRDIDPDEFEKLLYGEV